MKFFFSNLLFERSSCTVCDLILHAVYYCSLVTAFRSSRRAVHGACRNVIAYEIALITVSSRTTWKFFSPLHLDKSRTTIWYVRRLNIEDKWKIDTETKNKDFCYRWIHSKTKSNSNVIRTATIKSADNSFISRTIIFARVGFKNNFFFEYWYYTRIKNKMWSLWTSEKNHSSSIS